MHLFLMILYDIGSKIVEWQRIEYFVNLHPEKHNCGYRVD